jgi:hypothetical protein
MTENTADIDDNGDGFTLNPDLPVLPAFPVSQRDGAAGGRRMACFMNAYLLRVQRHLGVEPWKEERALALYNDAVRQYDSLSDAESKRLMKRLRSRASRQAKALFGRAVAAPRYQVEGSAGLGKTSSFVAAYKKSPALWSKRIFYFCPTISLGREFVAALNANAPQGMPNAKIVTGRTYADDHQNAPCRRAAIVKGAQGKVGSVYKSFCNDGDGNKCPFFETCTYIEDRKDSSPGIRVMPHANLVIAQAGDLEPIPPI